MKTHTHRYGPFTLGHQESVSKTSFTPEVIMPRADFKCPVSHFLIDKCSVSIQLLTSLQNAAPVPLLPFVHPFYKYFQSAY